MTPLAALFTDIGMGVIGLSALVVLGALGLIAQAVADRREDRRAGLDRSVTRHPSARARREADRG
jgi:hypothetical protein